MTHGVIEATRRMSPEHPWLLDEPLYTVGKSLCYGTDRACIRQYLRYERYFFDQCTKNY